MFILRKTLKVIFAFIIFSIYPAFIIVLLYSFGTIYLIFVPIVISFLLFLGWGVYGQKTESSNQSYLLSENPGFIILYWPSYFLIKTLKEIKVDLSTTQNRTGIVKNYLYPIEEIIIEHIKSLSEIHTELNGMINKSKLYDTSKAFKGKTTHNGFSLTSNLPLSTVLGNQHNGIYQLEGKSIDKIKIHSKISIILFIFMFLFYAMHCCFFRGILLPRDK